MSERTQHHSALWVNDRPDEYLGNGAEFTDGPYPHGHVYHGENRRHVVAVTFVAMNGRSIRVSFKPDDGSFTSQDITEHEESDHED